MLAGILLLFGSVWLVTLYGATARHRHRER